MKIDENVLCKLVDIRDKKKELNIEEKEILSSVMKQMKENNITKCRFNDVNDNSIFFEIIPEKKETIFDSIRFKKEQNDLVMEYQKDRTTKEKIKVTIN